MTESTAILEVRHVHVAEQVTLTPASLSDDQEGVFVALDDPPPVRTVMAVVEGDQRRALEVAWVVEVTERDERGTRGFYGRWVDDEALARAAKVGTEHLEDGTPVVQPVVSDDSVALDVSDAPVMAMPAPVMVVDDDTGVLDVSDEGSEDADAVAASEGETAGDESVDAAADDAASEDESAEAATEGEPVDAAAEDESAEAAEQEDHEAAESQEDPEGSSESSDAEQEPKSTRRSRGGRKKRGRRRR